MKKNRYYLSLALAAMAFCLGMVLILRGYVAGEKTRESIPAVGAMQAAETRAPAETGVKPEDTKRESAEGEKPDPGLPTDGHAMGNYGYVVCSGEKVYFSGGRTGIYSYSVSDKNAKQISDEVVSRIKLSDGQIYYQVGHEMICRMGLDGDAPITVLKTENITGDWFVYEDCIYYRTVGGKSYTRLGLSDKVAQKLDLSLPGGTDKDPLIVDIVDGILYCNSGDGLLAITSDLSQKKVVSDRIQQAALITGQRIYYYSYVEGKSLLFRSGLDGKRGRRLTDESTSSFYVEDGKIYYIGMGDVQKGLFRINTDGSGKVFLYSDDQMRSFSRWGAGFCCYDAGGNTFLLKENGETIHIERWSQGDLEEEQQQMKKEMDEEISKRMQEDMQEDMREDMREE